MREIDHRAEGRLEDQNLEVPDMGLGKGPEGTDVV